MQTPVAEKTLHVTVTMQSVELREATGAVLRRYPVSTSGFGLGSEPGSFRTPLGRFRIAEKIGADAPLGAVFKSRIPTGEIGFDPSGEDLVLTRILWLDGLEADNANTLDRYIYIHGTNQEDTIGQPVSHGCVRMKNADVAELYERVEVGTLVEISAD